MNPPRFNAQDYTLLADCLHIGELQELVRFLYDILDDIDTADDVAKTNDAAYREIVHRLQSKRHSKITSDGYGLFVKKSVDKSADQS